ncbi:MAG: right-handed parallel beta-helix repeat-containing protein [Thermoplasmata archaeon]
MHRSWGNGRRLAALFFPLAALAFLVVGGVGGVPAPSAEVHPTSAAIVVNGDWTISNPVTYNDTSILVDGGITIASGGTLALQNVSLSFEEPNDLANGIEVENGGGLIANGSTFESATTGNQLWMQADAGAHVSLIGGDVLDLGDSGGPEGFVVNAAGTFFDAVTFNDYYEALIISAENVTVENSYFGNTTSESSGTYVVSTDHASSGFVMTNSKVVDTSMAGGALFVTSQSDIENNTFTLNPSSTNTYPVLIGEWNWNGYENASGSKFAYNTVTGSSVEDEDSSDVEILSNKIYNTGGSSYVHNYGIHAFVLEGTGVDVWVNGLTIRNNFISDASGYGIRLDRNVSNFVIDDNNITNVSATPNAGEYNGVESLEGIYLIRGIDHGIVSGNRVDLSNDAGLSDVETNGIALESEVNNVTVSDNFVLNTDLGGYVQGDWDDSGENIGPSWDDTITGNSFINTIPITETADANMGFKNFFWANRTVFTNNYFSGWTMVPSGVSPYEGAAIMQSSAYGTFSGNIVNGATYGIVFSFNFGDIHENRSDNLVYNNLFNVTVAAVADNTGDGMGPIENVVNAETNVPTPAGTPTSYLQSIGPIQGLTLSESSGNYATTFETENPITGGTENFTTQVPWELPSFSVNITGNLGSGNLKSPIDAVTANATSYTLQSEGPLLHEVSLDVPAEYYTAAYSVLEGVGSSGKNSFDLNSSAGPAVFETHANGSLSVGVGLLGWNATNVTFQVHATNSTGSPVPGVVALVSFNEPLQVYSTSVGPTNASGNAAFFGLPRGTSVSNVSVEGSSYRVLSFSVENPEADLILLNLQVGNVSVKGAPTTYPVEFRQTGLGPGVNWTVAVSGPESAELPSSGPSVRLNLPNGSYQYVVSASSGYVPVSSIGEFSVLGAGSTLVVAFEHLNSTASTPPTLVNFFPPLSPPNLSLYVIGVVGAVAIWLIGMVDFFIGRLASNAPHLGRPASRLWSRLPPRSG